MAAILYDMKRGGHRDEVKVVESDSDDAGSADVAGDDDTSSINGELKASPIRRISATAMGAQKVAAPKRK